jgi:hypothetical protein
MTGTSKVGTSINAHSLAEMARLHHFGTPEATMMPSENGSPRLPGDIPQISGLCCSGATRGEFTA